MKLVVFDVDGTLVDSQALILSAMQAGLAAADLPPLPDRQVLSIVGLSLPVAVSTLVPDAAPRAQGQVVEGYRRAYMSRRLSDEAPLYPGARDCLDALAGRDDVLLAVATGKSRRGLDAILDHHGLARHFVALETADGNPSKPHPAMLLAACETAGVDPSRAAMIGDTVFDMQMARSAGVAGLGVSWGYHDSAALSAEGVEVASDFPALMAMIERWGA